MEFNAQFVLLAVGLVVLPSLVGGWMAVRKNDFFSRGFILSLLSSWYGPIFIYLAPPSRAREGDRLDQESWPLNGPIANMCLIATAVVGYLIYKWLS